MIWFTGAEGGPQFDQTPEALEVMDEWMTNILLYPDRSVADNRPARAVDRCFDTQGAEIAAGDHVWDGILDDEPPGTCTMEYPVFGTSRIVAGGPFRGSIFKCELKSVSGAIAYGDYGVWTPTPMEQALLEQIFPSGAATSISRTPGCRPAGDGRTRRTGSRLSRLSLGGSGKSG